jgi:hypothetical protein
MLTDLPVCRIEREDDGTFYAQVVVGQATVFAGGNTISELWAEMLSGVEIALALESNERILLEETFFAAARRCK